MTPMWSGRTAWALRFGRCSARQENAPRREFRDLISASDLHYSSQHDTNPATHASMLSSSHVRAEHLYSHRREHRDKYQGTHWRSELDDDLEHYRRAHISSPSLRR